MNNPQVSSFKLQGSSNVQAQKPVYSRITHHASRITFHALRSTLHVLTLLTLYALTLPSPAQSTNTYPIDLPTTLQLAGAQNLDVKIARERLAEARATHESAVAQFFPWIT